jgi:hypothetical protein
MESHAASTHLTHEPVLHDEQGREQLRRGYSSRAGRARAPRAMPGSRRGHEPRHGRARGREEVGRAGRASLGAPRAGTRRAAAPIRASALPGAGRVRAAAGNESAQGGAAPRRAGRHGRAHGTLGRLGRAPGPRWASAPGRGRGCAGIGVGEEGGARPPWPRAEATPRRAPGQRRAPRTHGGGGTGNKGAGEGSPPGEDDGASGSEGQGRL